MASRSPYSIFYDWRMARTNRYQLLLIGRKPAAIGSTERPVDLLTRLSFSVIDAGKYQIVADLDCFRIETLCALAGNPVSNHVA